MITTTKYNIIICAMFWGWNWKCS